MLSRSCLLSMAFLALAYKCAAFGGMQSHVPAAYSSPLFSSRAPLPRPKPTFASSNPDQDAEKATSGSSSSSSSNVENTSSNKESTKLFDELDNWGQSLKPKAIAKMEERKNVTDKKKSLKLTIQVCALWTLFLFYRAYRGFFVLLPAVFRETYHKLEYSVDSPFVDEPGTQDVNPETGKIRLRTRITVSVLAAMVTMTYVVGGIINVLMKFIKTATSSSSASSSFEAAAKEAEVYEDKMRKMTTKDSINGTFDGKPPFDGKSSDENDKPWSLAP